MAQSVAEQLVDRAAAVSAEALPPKVRSRCEDLLIDVAGLCVAARATDYIRALIASVDEGGRCTAIGHAGAFHAEDAAMINRTAAHGEDFDDTFEGGPVHSGAVIVPAVLAACERFGRDGRSALLGVATGVEALCRLSLVAPKLIHKAGFHPTSVLGAMAANFKVDEDGPAVLFVILFVAPVPTISRPPTVVLKPLRSNVPLTVPVPRDTVLTAGIALLAPSLSGSRFKFSRNSIGRPSAVVGRYIL